MRANTVRKTNEKMRLRNIIRETRNVWKPINKFNDN